ncbi:MAG: phage tail tape measure protein [Phycisphaeraceae bacterium]|nr:phage tail tape measure protein [Phycisphaeraceae bacterium]
MSEATAIRAGRAFVELFADDSRLVRGLRAAEKRLKAFGQRIRNLGLKLMGIGSAMLAPLLASARSFAAMGDSVAKMARRTGLSVEALSELQFAAGQSGLAVSDLENAIRRMQRTIYDAQRGLNTATEAMAQLGLTVDDLAASGASGGPEAQFKLLADHISQIEDPTRRAALAMQIFGRSGSQLLPLFASGARGIEILQAEARRLGLTMRTEDAQAAEVFTDALDRLWKVIRMGVFHIGAALAPTLKRVAEWLTRAAMAVSDWIRQNQRMIVIALKVAATVVAVGAALVALGTIIAGLGAAIGALITVITTVVAVFKALAGVIAALVSPIGLVITAVAALAGYLVYATGVGAKALGWLGDRFHALKDDAHSAYQGIADALAAGDIALAARVLWLTMKMEWTRGINFLEKAWLNFRNVFIRIGWDAWHGLLALAETVWHALAVGWIDLTSRMQRGWERATTAIANAWDWVVTGVAEGMAEVHGLIDPEVDVRAVQRDLRDQRDQRRGGREDERDRRIADIDRDQDQRRDARLRLHEQTMSEIGRRNLEKHSQLDAEYERRMAENEEDLRRARQEWREAIDEAQRQRTRRTRDDSRPEGLEGPEDIIDRARDALYSLGDIGDLIEQQAANIGVRGTFNAAAIRGLGTGDAADRTAKATEETARNTKRLAQSAQAGGLTFA